MDGPPRLDASSTFLVWRDPVEAWEENWTFVVLQLAMFALATATLVHAIRVGRAGLLLWLAAVGHGLFVEGFCYALPELDNFHHGRALVAIFGGRMPGYVVVLYPAFYYSAAQLASMLLGGLGSQFSGLRALGRRRREASSEGVVDVELVATAALTGLLTALVDVPYDAMGPKLLHWSWHPDDPNVFERTGPFIPTTSFIFHITFAASWLLVGAAASRVARMPCCGKLGWIPALLVASLLPFPLGVMQIQLFYVVPHDLACVPTATCLAAAVGAYLVVIVLCAWWLRGGVTRRVDPSIRRVSALPVLALLSVFSCCFVAFAALADPAGLSDTGVHLPVAVSEEACSRTETMLSLGGVATKSMHLCSLPDRASSGGPLPLRPGDRSSFPLVGHTLPAAHCAMPEVPHPFRVANSASEAQAGVIRKWTMIGTEWGAEGPASTRAAMLMVVCWPVALMLTTVLAAWSLDRSPSLAHSKSD